MIGLGQIATIGNANRIHEMRLFREVESVDEKEAEQGALHSDVLRLNSRERDGNQVMKRGLTHQLSRLWRSIKSKTAEAKQENPEEDCPIARARAQSAVGENAPLGWLTFDQMGEADKAAPSMEKLSSKKKPKADEADSLAFLKTDPEDHDYMFCEEWFLSPCG